MLDVQPAQAQVSVAAPATVTYGNSAKIKVTYQTDSPRQLFVTELPGSTGSCPATFGKAPGTSIVLSGDSYFPSDPVGGAGNPSGTLTYQSSLLSSSTIVCAWIQSDSNATTADAGPVRALLKVIAPPPKLTFKGHTSQGLPIKLITQGRTVLEIEYKVRYACRRAVHFSTGVRWNGVSRDAVLNSNNFGNLRIGAGGTFLAKLDGTPLNRVHIGGHLKGKRIRGALTAGGRTDGLVGSASYPRVTCSTGRVTYSVARR